MSTHSFFGLFFSESENFPNISGLLNKENIKIHTGKRRLVKKAKWKMAYFSHYFRINHSISVSFPGLHPSLPARFWNLLLPIMT
jgi:hypothetical protein